jgi:ubiquinone/menaquinone biosynthesis C-methylase UbiE
MAKILDTWGERNAWIEVQHIFNDKKRKILDIACGTGKVIEILGKKYDLDIYGCDISTFLIDKAKKNISEKKLMVCDPTDLPYETNSFDYCYFIGSLEHFTESGILSFLKSSSKVTKNNGYHMIPVSRTGKDYGWIENYQSYFNNSVEWWSAMCEKVSLKYKFIDSSWEDEISVGKWMVVKKDD